MNLITTRFTRRAASFVAIAALTLSFTPTGGKTSAANEGASQVIFSGQGLALEGGFPSRVGYWVWCSAEGNGPYAESHPCKGAVYVYRAGHTKGVHGFMTEEPDGTYTMHVFSNHEGELEGTLHNVSPEILHGPNNTVEFSLTTEFGLSIGESTDSVVNVTGPGN